MCGRSSLTKTEKEIEERFGSTFYSDELERYNPLPNYNVAPTHVMPVITNQDPQHIQLYRWGLVPFWAKDIKVGYKMINARKETLTSKSAFRNALQSKRCLVPMDGFYEWKTVGKAKTPYRIVLPGSPIFSVAGLWETWRNEVNEVVHTFTVITQEPNELMADIHDRMPAILPAEIERLWIDDTITPDAALDLISPYPSSQMHAYEVTAKVGNVKVNDPSLIEPINKNNNFVQGELF